jgi:uncharacterized membrane protein YqaE (UPF0057 family)
MFIFNCCLCICCQLPFAIFSILVLFMFFTSLIIFAPPLAILVSALPFLKGLQYNVFDKFEPAKADIYDGGSKDYFNRKLGKKLEWYEHGWVRAFFLCSLLTLLGWIPGVCFAAYIGIVHFRTFLARL